MAIGAIQNNIGQAAAAASPRVGANQAGARPAASDQATAGSTHDQAPPTRAASASSTELSAEALALIGKLKARDTQVRQHEQAHLAAAGGLALSGTNYTYQRGPNGVNYAIGGEVQIDTSPGRTPQETIERARTVVAAALAPADPSGADLAIAAQAQQMGLQARGELAAQQAPAQSADGASAAPREGQPPDTGDGNARPNAREDGANAAAEPAPRGDRQQALRQAYGLKQANASLLNVVA